MPSRNEIAQALHGAWRFALLDRQAMHYFDLSHRGVWRSFWAAPICYPGFLALLLMRLDQETLSQSGFGYVLIVETLGYIIAWTAFPLAVLGFCRWLGHEDEGFEFITAYNWSQILQTVLFVLVTILSVLLLPARFGANLGLAAYLAVLGYEWFIANVAVAAGGWIAAAIVAIDVVLGVSIAIATASLY